VRFYVSFRGVSGASVRVMLIPRPAIPTAPAVNPSPCAVAREGGGGRTRSIAGEHRETGILGATTQRSAVLTEQQMATAKVAVSLWDRSTPAARTHPYLVAKGVQPYAIRQIGARLLLPVRIDGQLRSLPSTISSGCAAHRRSRRPSPAASLRPHPSRGKLARPRCHRAQKRPAMVRPSPGSRP
jgi:hypothetical protein